MRFAQFRRGAVLTLVAGALAGTSACFGSFNLTRKVYGFNKDVSKDKFVQELVFLAFNIVPVYGIAGFLDAVVVNTVEFWTGKNPVQMSSTIRLDGTTTVNRVIFEKDGARYMTVKTFQSGSLLSTTTLRHVPGTDYVSYKTAVVGGRTVSNVVAMGADGGAVVAGAEVRRSVTLSN